MSSCCRDEFLLSGPVGTIYDRDSLQLKLIFIFIIWLSVSGEIYLLNVVIPKKIKIHQMVKVYSCHNEMTSS